METKTVEVYSEVTNRAVVRVPSREFPGALVQGDSLYVLFYRAMTVVADLDGGDEDAFLEALALAEQLESYLLHYEAVLNEHEIQIPYVRDPGLSTAKYSHRWRK